jgi:hypothetical protein
MLVKRLKDYLNCQDHLFLIHPVLFGYVELSSTFVWMMTAQHVRVHYTSFLS